MLFFAAAAVLVVLILRHWMATKQYVFNKEDVAKLAKQYAGEFGSVRRVVLIWVSVNMDSSLIHPKDTVTL